MQFSLANTKGTSTIQPKLKGNEIHDVVFKGVTFTTFKNKKDENDPYKVMKIRFENEDGYFEHTVFAPKEGDDVRPSNERNGVTKESPSNLERLQFLMAHIGEQLSPTNYEKFKTLSWDLPTDFEKMVKTFQKATACAEGKKTKLKLIQNNKGEAQLPFFVNLSKEGEPFISNNFLGEKVFFTDYEIKKMEDAKNAKPTDMEGDGLASDSFGGEVAGNEDLNFNL